MAEINIKDFFVDDETKIEKKKSATKKSEVTYSTILVSGDSFIIRRKSSASSKLLVIIPGKKLFYIQDEKKKTNTIIDKDLMRGFMNDATSPIKIVDENGNEPFWISTLYRGAQFAKGFVSVISNEKFYPFMCANTIHFGDILTEDCDDEIRFNEKRKNSPQDFSQFINIAKKYFAFDELKMSLCEKICKRQYSYRNNNTNSKISSMIVSLFEQEPITTYCGGYYRDTQEYTETLFCTLKSKYGIEGIEKITRAYSLSPVNQFISLSNFKNIFDSKYLHSNSYSANKIGEKYLKEISTKVEYGIEEFCDYAFCEIVKQGFANAPSNFYQSWADCLSLQFLIYNRIEDKYPEHLASYEQILSYTWSTTAEQKETEEFTKAVEGYSKYQYDGDKYCIISPKTISDLIDEGRMQSNCVGSYVDRVAAGECMIFFMRDKNDTTKSLVTVEVRPTSDRRFRLGQVLGKFNRCPSDEQREFVNKWFKNIFEKRLKKEQEENEKL